MCSTFGDHGDQGPFGTNRRLIDSLPFRSLIAYVAKEIALGVVADRPLDDQKAENVILTLPPFQQEVGGLFPAGSIRQVALDYWGSALSVGLEG